MGLPAYIGIFLTPQSRRALLREHPPLHPEVHADHVTVVYQPSEADLEKVQLGSVVKFRAKRAYSDDKGQALVVTLPPELARLSNRTPHITVSSARGTPPVYSNKLIQEGGGEPAGQLYTGILDVPSRKHPVRTRRFPLAYSDNLSAWSAPNQIAAKPSAPEVCVESTTAARADAQSKAAESRIPQKGSASTTTTHGEREPLSRRKSFRSKRSVPSTSADAVAKSKATVERITTRYAARVQGRLSGVEESAARFPSVRSSTTPRGTASGIITSGNATEILHAPSEPSKVLEPSPKKVTGSSPTTENASLNIGWSCPESWDGRFASPSESTTSTASEPIIGLKTWSYGFSATPRDNEQRTKFSGHERSWPTTATCSPNRVATRCLQARDYFEVGDVVLYGKWKNLRGRIVAWGKDHKGNPTVEIEPIPKGRKKNKIFGLFKMWKYPPPAIAEQMREQEETSKVANTDWVNGYFARHPKLRGYAGVKVLDKVSGASASHGEARQHGREIWLFPKFWKLDRKLQDWVFTHEIGHYVLSKYGTAAFIKTAYAGGVDPWDTPSLPYGQFNMDEAFADTFAAYFLNPGELKSRYPAWSGLVKDVVSKVRTADLSPPLGYPGGPCHVVKRIDQEVRNPRMEDKLIDLVESGRGLSNPEARSVYQVETERGPWKFKRMNLTSHAQYRMDLRGVTVPEVRLAINNFFRAYNNAKSKQKDPSAQREAQTWEMAMMRRQEIRWVDPRTKLTVVFTADADRHVLNVITVFWEGQRDPPAPGVCRVAKAHERRVIRRLMRSAPGKA